MEPKDLTSYSYSALPWCFNSITIFDTRFQGSSYLGAELLAQETSKLCSKINPQISTAPPHLLLFVTLISALKKDKNFVRPNSLAFLLLSGSNSVVGPTATPRAVPVVDWLSKSYLSLMGAA